ncbi:MAG: hypothetical protein ACLVL7_10135 [Anaerotruncus massiliensis (ex Togo et al. 2019)]
MIPFSGIGDTTAIIALTAYALCRWCATPTPASPRSTPRYRGGARRGSTDPDHGKAPPLAMTAIVAGWQHGRHDRLFCIAAFIGAGLRGSPRHHHQQHQPHRGGKSLIAAVAAKISARQAGALLKKKWRLEQ